MQLRFFTVTALLSAVILSAGGRRYIPSGWPYHTIPQIADGANWTTTVTLVNVGMTTQKYKLTFRGDDGKLKDFSVQGRGRSDTFSGTIPGGG